MVFWGFKVLGFFGFLGFPLLTLCPDKKSLSMGRNWGNVGSNRLIRLTGAMKA
jgi:hypothetical protein